MTTPTDPIEVGRLLTKVRSWFWPEGMVSVAGAVCVPDRYGDMQLLRDDSDRREWAEDRPAEHDVPAVENPATAGCLWQMLSRYGSVSICPQFDVREEAGGRTVATSGLLVTVFRTGRQLASVWTPGSSVGLALGRTLLELHELGADIPLGEHGLPILLTEAGWRWRRTSPQGVEYQLFRHKSEHHGNVFDWDGGCLVASAHYHDLSGDMYPNLILGAYALASAAGALAPMPEGAAPWKK